MRNDAYLRRKELDPHTFLETPRYVTGRLHSHYRPVVAKKSNRHKDDPLTRGVTVPYGQATTN
jgi:hypothetical protein